MVPAMTITSAWRGVARTMVPIRSMSTRLAAVAMNSMPQQLVAMGNTHRALLIPQVSTSSSTPVATESPGTLRSVVVERVLEARPVVDRPHTHSSAPFRMAQAQPSISTPTKVPTATSPAVPTSRTIVPQGRMSAASMSKRTKNRATT